VEFPKCATEKKPLLHHYAVEKEGSSTARGSGSGSGREGESGIKSERLS